MSVPQTHPEAHDPAEELLESSWSGRGRRVQGRELRLELLVTAVFFAAVTALLVAAPVEGPVGALVVLVVVGYAIAARTEFPVGAAIAVPTQVFLVALFAVAPAALVPALVFGGLAIGVVGAAVIRQTRIDRLVFCAGDALHSLGPATVLVLLAGGDATQAGVTVLVLAFASQLLFDFASSSLHDLLVFGIRPGIQMRVQALAWAVDAALLPVGIVAAAVATEFGPAVLAPLPLVALLAYLARDRTRRIAAATERLEALQHERRRHEGAIQRLGEAFGSTHNPSALLDVVVRAATDALDGTAGRVCTIDGSVHTEVGDTERWANALAAAEHKASSDAALASVHADAEHAIAAVLGRRSSDRTVVSIARSTAFSASEAALLANLCRQASTSMESATQHRLLQDAEARLRHLAYHDALTGLPNRTLFASRVGAAAERAAEDGASAVVALIDLDGFKLVNDSLGHEAGDELLATVATRLGASVRPGDTAARLGGDELAVLLEDVDAMEEGVAIAERVRRELSVATRIRARDVAVRCSVGVAPVSPGLDRDTVLRHADLAMYAAKRAGGGRVELFHEELASHADAHAELANELKHAAQRGELELRFQPIFDLEDHSVLTIEALVRWRHPRLGLVTPRNFIPLAEETGSIWGVCRFVLDEACRVASTWLERDGRAPSVSVNISAPLLREPQLPDEVAATLHRHGLSAQRLVLEVTESVAVEPDDRTRTCLERLRALGVRVALDDFGTGYSSLSYLAQLPLDLLKLDRTFLADIDSRPAQARLVGGVIDLARSLGIPVVAEGIEDPEQLGRVRALGARFGQGFLFGAPCDAAMLARRLAGTSEAATAAAPLLSPVSWASSASS